MALLLGLNMITSWRGWLKWANKIKVNPSVREGIKEFIGGT